MTLPIVAIYSHATFVGTCHAVLISEDMRGLQVLTLPLLSSVKGKRLPCPDGKLQMNWLLGSNAESYAINLLRLLHICSARGEPWAAISRAPEPPASTPIIRSLQSLAFWRYLHCPLFCFPLLFYPSTVPLFEMPFTLSLLIT